MTNTTFDTTAIEQFQQAVAHYAAGRLQPARDLYAQILERYPEHAESHYNLATVYMQLMRWDEAIGHYQQAQSIQPKMTAIQYNLAIALFNSTRVDEAVTWLKQVLSINPEHFDSHLMLGCIYLQQGQFKLADPYFLQAIKMRPNDIEANYNFGLSLLRQNHLGEARVALHRTLVIQDQFPEAHYNLGIVDLSLGDDLGAAEHLETAIAQQPNYYEAHYNLAMIYKQRHQMELAIIHCEAALALHPDDATMQFMRSAINQSQLETVAPADYVRSLFDHYAGHYERHVQQRLEYQVPQQLFALWQKYADQPARKRKILDLGCGTGLAGVLFQPLASRLVGVDLSKNMLAIANERGIYTELQQQEVVVYLNRVTEVFDLIIAADVLVYMGDLSMLFANAWEALEKGGIFMFSIEAGDSAGDSGYQLLPSARFAHSKQYIENLAEQFNWQIIACEQTNLRRQEKEIVTGWLFMLRR